MKHTEEEILSLEIEPAGFDMLIEQLIPGTNMSHKSFIEMLSQQVDQSSWWFVIDCEGVEIKFIIASANHLLLLKAFENYFLKHEQYEALEDIKSLSQKLNLSTSSAAN
ncbi:hypothetical protein E9993_01905 [Labilibacter sediminis]|nr:hypothetical protein E9993_01905 [Labilibacter sediminis]